MGHVPRTTGLIDVGVPDGGGGRVVEGARLLSEYTAKSRIVGSNPILPANYSQPNYGYDFMR